MANTFKFGNGNWAVKDGSALAYNDENNNFKPLPFDFTRASSATRVNKQGLIETVPSGKPRIDFTDNTSGHLLLEPQRTNVIINSENLNGSGWSVFGASGGTVTRTSNYGISPSGELNSTRVVFSDGTTALYSSASGITGNASASIYVKGTVGEIIGFGFGGSVADGSDFIFNGEWQRLEFNGTSANSNLTINTWSASRNARDFEVYGVQMEAGSYATSYIPTEGSSVTRVAETCNNAGNSTVFNDSEGVLYAEFSSLYDDGNERYIEITDGTTSNRVVIRLSPISNQIRALVSSGGTNVFSDGYVVSDTTETHKVAVVYKQNDFALWIDGVERATDTSGIAPTGLDVLNLSRSGVAFYGKVKDLKVYNTALTDTELQNLTS